MANPFYNALGGAALGGMNPANLLQQLRSNPVSFLKQAGLNVPDNLNTPDGIIQHLMNSGQVSQNQYNRARQMAQRLGFKQ